METIKEAIAQNGLPFEFEGKQYFITEVDNKKAAEEFSKAQKEIEDESYRRGARNMALEVATKSSLHSGTAESMTNESETIYQWLIKVLGK